MDARERLIVALDILDEKKCLEMIDILSPEVEFFKVGMAPFTGFGKSILEKLNKLSKKVFLDLKFHDIPNTVYNVSKIAAGLNVTMMNYHCLGSSPMLKEAVRGAEEGAEENRSKRPILLAVTVLTSMNEKNLREIGIGKPIEQTVIDFAVFARDAGMDGVVASSRETKLIKEAIGQDFVVVTPGIRPSWAEKGDQKRVNTPKDAIMNGSDYIVVGRPIISSENPLASAKSIIEEIRLGATS